MLLPKVSSAAALAPKHCGQQDGVRRLFWESESDKYWERCKRTKHRMKKKVVIAASVILVVAFLGTVVAWQRNHKADSKEGLGIIAKDQAAGRATGILRLRTQSCTGSGARHDLESKTCAKACAKVRNAAPRPLTHRSCLAGCRAGLATAWDAGCAGGRYMDCVKYATGQCDFLCATYHNRFPKPTVFNYCRRSCFDVVDDACLKAKEVFVAAEMTGSSLADEI